MKFTNTVFYIILFTILMQCFSCKTASRNASFRAQYREVYIEQFRLTYFRQLLARSYNNSKAIQEIIDTDHSGFTEPILTDADYKLIDSLTMIDNRNLIADSVEGNRRAEGSAGKRPLVFIMNKLSDRSLDRLAKQRLKLNGDPNSWIY